MLIYFIIFSVLNVKFRFLIPIVSILLITLLIMLISLLILRAPLKTTMASWAPSLNIAIIIIIIIIINSGSNRKSNFKIRRARSARPI